MKQPNFFSNVVSLKRFRLSCCEFKTPNGIFGKAGLLDIYLVKPEGQEDVIKLYLNMYDYGVLKAPKGLTFKQ